MDNIKTKAGIQPVQTELPFSITTSDAEKYLQEKFNMLKGDNANMTVSLFTTEVSPKFLPFMLLLPKQASKNGSKKKNDNVLSIFNTDTNENNGVALHNDVFAVIAPYIFNKADEQAFFSPDWRRERQVSSATSHKLKYSRTPHIQKYNKGQIEFVAMLIDPIRLFYDMLSDPTKQENFRVSIRNMEKVKTGEYRYTVSKIPVVAKKKNHNYEEILAQEINRKMRG